MMKSLILALVTFAAITAFVPEANAVVCARGVYRAGCVGYRGAAVRHAPYYHYRYPYYRRGVVGHRRYW
jgi:hypothetical protein